MLEGGDHVSEASDYEDEITGDVDGDNEIEDISSQTTAKQYIAKSSRIWSSKPPPVSRAGMENIVRTQSGPTACATQTTAIADTFRLMFNKTMIENIVKWSNTEGRRQMQLNNSDNRQWNDISVEELEAVIGLLILSGAFWCKPRIDKAHVANGTMPTAHISSSHGPRTILWTLLHTVSVLDY
jgi:hypothetical protein